MKKFILSLMGFSFPFLTYLSIVLMIDPFNYFGGGGQDGLAKSIEPHLYKLLEYRNTPKKNIVLGDSRSNALYPIIQNKRGESWGTLAYGGASLKEMVDTYWWLIENDYDVDTIVVNVNFNHLNDYNRRDWISSTKSIIQNPVSYASSRYPFLYLYQKALQKFGGDAVDGGKIDKERFWSEHIDSIKGKFYINHKYSNSYIDDLHEVASSCSQQGIKLIIWSSPVHQDIHTIIDNSGKRGAYAKAVSDLQEICEYHDFNERRDWIGSKNNFRDAMHVEHNILQELYVILFEKTDL